MRTILIKGSVTKAQTKTGQDCFWHATWIIKRSPLAWYGQTDLLVPNLLCVPNDDKLFLPTWLCRTKCFINLEHTEPADKALGLHVKTLIMLLYSFSTSDTNSCKSCVIKIGENKYTAWEQQRKTHSSAWGEFQWVVKCNI